MHTGPLLDSVFSTGGVRNIDIGKVSVLMVCFFATDLHGSTESFKKLFRAMADEKPEAVFLGGDLLPSAGLIFSAQDFDHPDFINGFLAKRLMMLRESLKNDYPRVFIILGNDDSRMAEAAVKEAAAGVWEYIHNKHVTFGEFSVYGYSFVPPTPFLLKDWEKYDVSRFVDPGCVSPEEGIRSIPVSENELKYSTILQDLELLAGGDDLSKAIFLFHAPPYKTKLDRASLDGKTVEYVPLDVHVGSIAIQRFIKTRQPLLTLHGHVHESPRLSGTWRDRIGNTHMFTAAHDGPELALVRFDPDNLEGATRELL